MAHRATAGQREFLTPERLAQEQGPRLESLRGNLLIASCRSGGYLARQVTRRYDQLLKEEGSEAEVYCLGDIDFQFSDSETCARLDRHVGGYDVFLFQALYDPMSDRQVDQNYMAFLIATRAFREHGAEHVTAVLPYLAYSRQDKPTKFKREPTTAKLMADLSIEAGIDRLVTWAPHSSQVHGFYGSIRVDALESLTLLVNQFQHFEDRTDVIAVAPDEGASRFVTLFSRALGLRFAVASKYRPQPEEVVISQVIGDFTGVRVAVVLDDMIASGGTLYAVVRKLVEEKQIEEVYVGVSHNLCMERAQERLQELRASYHLKKVVVTNSIPQTETFQSMPFVSVESLSDTLARVINRIHYNRSVSELFYSVL
jgi:ribose-phosphate pyrophosphokinase